MTGLLAALWARANARAGLVVAGVCAVLFLISLVYTPHDPLALSIRDRMAAPSPIHWMGTDHLGRDVFSRVMAAGLASLRVSLLVVAVALTAGAVIGAVAGYFGGWTDRLIHMALDAVLAIPGLVLALAIMFVAGAGEASVVLALGVAFTPAVARIVRAQAMSLRRREFVEASLLSGRAWPTVIAVHILPNTLSQLTILGATVFVQALLAESALSFLGLGVPPPYPTLGGMLAEARPYIASAPWLSLFPGAVILTLLVGVNLIGDGLRDHFDPRGSEGGRHDG